MREQYNESKPALQDPMAELCKKFLLVLAYLSLNISLNMLNKW